MHSNCRDCAAGLSQAMEVGIAFRCMTHGTTTLTWADQYARLTRERDAAMRFVRLFVKAMDDSKILRMGHPVEIFDNSWLDDTARSTIHAIETGAIHNDQ